MIRYFWNGEAKHLYATEDFKKEDGIAIPPDPFNRIFVNIIKRVGSHDIRVKVKLFYANGTVLEGWTALNNDPISFTAMDELFDGRFNV